MKQGELLCSDGVQSPVPGSVPAGGRDTPLCAAPVAAAITTTQAAVSAVSAVSGVSAGRVFIFFIAEPWDYVSFRSVAGSEGGSRMPGPGDRADISYQVASKQELEVIYEGAGRGRGRTKLYLGAGLVVLVVVLGAGAGVAAWAGLLGGGDTDSVVASESSQQVRGTHVTTRHSTSVVTTTVQTTTSTSTSTTLKREYKLIYNMCLLDKWINH